MTVPTAAGPPSYSCPSRRSALHLALPWLVLAFVSASTLAGCTTAHGSFPQAPAAPAALSVPATPLPLYRIQLGDVLDVRLLLNPELNEEVLVRPDGRISTAIVPDEVALGRTPGELAIALRARYARELVNPRLSVVVKTIAPTRLYVSGEVNLPGEMATIGPALTLSQAIARAGGVKPSGDVARVFIIRRGAGDAPELYATNYEGVIRGRTADADVRLASHDVVHVPKTGIDRKSVV